MNSWLEAWMRAVIGVAMVMALGVVPAALAKGEYQGKYLYTETSDSDPGGLVLELRSGAPPLRWAIAVARLTGNPYRGTIDGNTIRFHHLPIDIYDLLLVGDRSFYEALQLSLDSDAAAVAREGTAIDGELAKVEAFFEGKQRHRLAIDGINAVVLLQQWRIGVALAESGARLEGTIHSLDLVWFEKPMGQWQLVRRRQLYRDEIELKTPLRHVHLPALGGFRVLDRIKTVRDVDLKETAAPETTSATGRKE
jgi:hypothetical protein